MERTQKAQLSGSAGGVLIPPWGAVIHVLEVCFQNEDESPFQTTCRKNSEHTANNSLSDRRRPVLRPEDKVNEE